MSQGGVPYPEMSALVGQLNNNSLLVRQLQAVCGNNGLSRGGVKADLRNRIINLVQTAYTNNDAALFCKLKGDIQNVIAGRGIGPPPLVPPASHQPNYHASSAMPSWSRPSQSPYPGRPNPPSAPSTPHSNTRIFKPSPFYETQTLIGKVYECPAMAHHRNTVTAPIRLIDHPDLEKCLNSKEYRVMVFCADGLSGPQDIAFPHSSEIKVNGGEIKANLRGLKKKPGSTRPVDITDHLRLRGSYLNNVDFTYALTNKKFYLVIYVCKVAKTEELVARVRNGKRILKDTVVRDLISKANDPDIEATSQVMSLKCPLSYMRLSLPTRGVGCRHERCFDCTSYLQLQEQGPQWQCPICHGNVPYEQLAVDEYVLDILSKTPRDLEQVTIEPTNGEWKVAESPRAAAPKMKTESFELLDDLEIASATPVSGVNKSSVTPSRSVAPSIGTPMSDARNSPAMSSRPGGGMSAKRPAAPVIDLTLSSDEEDEVRPPAPKRQQLAFNGLMSQNYDSFY